MNGIVGWSGPSGKDWGNTTVPAKWIQRDDVINRTLDILKIYEELELEPDISITTSIDVRVWLILKFNLIFYCTNQTYKVQTSMTSSSTDRYLGVSYSGIPHVPHES